MHEAARNHHAAPSPSPFLSTLPLTFCADGSEKQPQPLRQGITLDELRQHSTAADAWIALKGKVYDITAYVKYHPGGAKVVLKEAGKDATQVFAKHHAWVDADYILAKSAVGWLERREAAPAAALEH